MIGQKRTRSNGKTTATLVVVLASLLLAGLIGVQASSFAATTSGFMVASAVWGTPASPVEATPGTQNVPLTISLQYNYYNTAQGISATLALPAGFTDTNGNTMTTAYYASPVTSGTIISFTFDLNIADTVTLGTYDFPMTISWGAVISTNPSQSVSETQNTYASIALKGTVQLQFTANQPAITPGVVTSVPLAVGNTGTGNASKVSLAISATTSLLAPSSVSVLNTPPQIPSVPANSSVETYVNVYAPLSLSGSSATLTVVATYYDAYGNVRSTTSSVGIFVRSIASYLVTVRALSFSLTPGVVNNETLLISNVGQQTLEQVQVSVTVPPSVSVLGQFPVVIAALQPGANAQVSLPLFVSAALAGSPVSIPVSMAYVDAAGNTASFTQNLGFYVPLTQSAALALSGYAYVPDLIYPGTTVASLQVTLVNSGTTAASDINVTVIPSSPVYSISEGSLARSLGMLPVGQAVPLTFMIGILNSSSPINSTLTLSVQYSGGKPLQYSIPFNEQPEANIRLVSVSAPQLSAGDSSDQITATVRNFGVATAQLVTFTMEPSNVFQPGTSGSFYAGSSAAVGTLAPGRSANLTLAVQVNSNIQPGSYPLTMVASWNQLGTTQTFTQEASVDLKVNPSALQAVDASLTGTLGQAVAVIVVLALAALVVRRRLRRKG